MLDFQLRAAAWRAEYIAPYCDDPIGMPANGEAWLTRVDLQNYDSAWAWEHWADTLLLHLLRRDAPLPDGG